MTGNEPVFYDEISHQQKLAEQKQELESKERIARLQAESEEKRSKNRVREARQTTYQNVGIAAVFASIVLGITFAVYKGTSGPESNEPGREERREEACVASGGGWVSEDLLYDSNEGLCVYPRQVTP